MSCRRPSNRSSRLALPSGPSNAYSFSTESHGIRRRSAASASRARVTCFSFTSSRWRAASHSSGVTIGGVFIVVSAFPFNVLRFRGAGCGWLAGGAVEVALQRAERGVPVAGQRRQELLRHLHRRRAHPVAHPAPLP